MIMHAGGWVTLYGHNQRLLVVPGEHVARGQAIAELGSTGRSMGPHVHFELVHDGVNCDPLPLFRYETANGPERMPQAALATLAAGRSAPQERALHQAPAASDARQVRSGVDAGRRQLRAARRELSESESSILKALQSQSD